jgi:hypothetical protein
VDASRFSPDTAVTRGHMGAFLDRLHGAVTGRRFPAGPDAFTGDEGDVRHESINAIAAAGIGVGVTGRDFARERQVTRGQTAGFLARVVDVQVADGRIGSAFDTPAEPAPEAEPGPEPSPERPPPPPFTGEGCPTRRRSSSCRSPGSSARSSGRTATTC